MTFVAGNQKKEPQDQDQRCSSRGQEERCDIFERGIGNRLFDACFGKDQYGMGIVGAFNMDGQNDIKSCG